MTDYDYGTINRSVLETLPVAKLDPTYHLQDDPGNGCYGDPPGHPSYFTRNVYTQVGNTPSKGASMLLLNHVIQRADKYDYDGYRQLLERLYAPLPYDHPRVQAWELAKYTHFKNCYTDTLGIFPEEYGRAATVIWPVPDWRLKHFHDDERFSEEWRTKEKAAIEQANREIIEMHRPVCVPENHAAVQAVRKFYPDAPIRHDLIENPPKRGPGNWWERQSERPTPETCPGDRHVNLEHDPTRWCQFCGYGG